MRTANVTQMTCVVVACSVALACSSSENGAKGPVERIGATAQAYDTSADLLSPSNCTIRLNYLMSCGIPARSLTGLPVTSTAVPLRTTFTTKKSGNCSTQYPLQVTLQAPGAADVVFPFLSNASAAIRRHDGQPMPSVTIVDSSPWTAKATFDKSCTVSMTISSNEPDVNSKADADAIIAALEADLSNKTAIANHYQALALYASAYSFLEAVSNNLVVELTNETIQQLRQAAQGAQNALSNLISSSCMTLRNPDGTPVLTQDDQNNLFTLVMDLPALGSASDFVNDAGKPMTLGDYLGPDQSAIVASIKKLTAAMDTQGDYTKAEADVQAATAKLAQAKAQLASWIN